MTADSNEARAREGVRVARRAQQAALSHLHAAERWGRITDTWEHADREHTVAEERLQNALRILRETLAR